MKNSSLNLNAIYIGKTNLKNILFYLVLVFMLGYFAITPLRNARIRHIFVLGGAIIIYCMSLYNMAKTKYSVTEIFRLMTILVLLIVGTFFTQRSTYEAVYAYLNFLALYIILTTKTRHKSRVGSDRILYVFSIAVAVCLFIAYLSPAAYVFEDGRRTKALALGMTNPNLTGMMITGVIELLMIGYKERKHKILVTLIVIGLFYLVWLTNARSSLVASILALIYALFFADKDIPNFIICFSVAMPLAFVPVYLSLYRNGVRNLALMGKNLFSGREYVYVYYLNQINTPLRWLFGNLGEILFFNAHNAPLMILCSIGLAGLAVTYYGFARNLIILNNAATEPVNRTAIACILSFCVQSCGEGLMFSGIFPSIGFMYIFMSLATQDIEC